MPYFFTTTVSRSDTDQLFDDSLQLTNQRYAMRISFKPIKGNGGQVDKHLGVFAEISAPESADISSIAVRLHGDAASGSMYLSTVDPQVSYSGFFLYTFISDILPTVLGPSIYRKTEIHPGAYNTSVMNERKIYALILEGPELDSGEELIADIAITAHSA
jgi:hypothetical protein